MAKQKNYKKTPLACYSRFCNPGHIRKFCPALIFDIQEHLRDHPGKIAMIPMVFYFSQLLVDLAATRFADKIGYRTCVVVSQVVSAMTLASMAFLPDLLPVPFAGILISVLLQVLQWWEALLNGQTAI